MYDRSTHLVGFEELRDLPCGSEGLELKVMRVEAIVEVS